MRRQICFAFLISFLTLMSVLATSVSGQDKVHIWIKGFLPKDHPNNPGYVSLPITAVDVRRRSTVNCVNRQKKNFSSGNFSSHSRALSE
jgi:hypothetical protein